MFNSLVTRNSIVLAFIGILPGILVISLGFFNRGLGLLILGFCAGVLLGVPGVVPSRALKLLLSVFIVGFVPFAKYIPSLRNSLTDFVDEAESEENPKDKLAEWLLTSHVTKRRGWLVVTTMIIGALTSTLICIKEISDIKAGVETIFLPMQGARDSLTTQGVLITISITIWSGVLGSFIASSTYRRPVCSAAFSSLVVGMSASLVSNLAISMDIIFFAFVPIVSGMVLLFMAIAAFDSLETGVDKEQP